MKRLTITLPDNVDLDLSTILSKVIDLRMETIEDTKAIKKRVVHRDPNISTIDCIMEHYGPSVEFSKSNAETWFKKAGFNPSGISATLSRLRKGGFIEKLSNTRWKFLKGLKNKNQS